MNSSLSWRSTLAILAVTSAVAVSILYLPQSMLTEIAASFDVPPSTATTIATAVQVGYAVGIFLLVPLADRFHPKKQVTVQSVLLAGALLISSALPGLVVVAVGFLCAGLVANIAQILIPVANKLSPPDRRGSTTGSIAGALIVGIFGGRIVSSVLVDAIGWRWVVVLFAGVVLATVPFVRAALNAAESPGDADRTYRRLLADTVRMVAEPSVLTSALIQFFVFATFNSMWTVMVVHLTGAPFGWSVTQAGLFGFAGLLAGLVTPFSSHAIDRFGAAAVTALGLAVLIVAAASAIADSYVVAVFAVSMFVVTLANQTIQSATQTQVLNTNPGREAQANTVFMVFVFLGGSLGAVIGPIAFDGGGMSRVALQATVLVAAAMVVLVVAHMTGRSRKSNSVSAIGRPSMPGDNA